MNCVRIFFAIVFAAMFVSCGSSSKSSQGENETLPMELSAEDTIVVTQMVDSFFTSLIHENYSAAVSLLRHSSSLGELSESEKADMMNSYQAFKVSSYKIKDLKFVSDLENEVSVNVMMRDSMELTWRFAPYRYYGTWLLTVKNN